ncbi:hypothetical protein AFLA_001550 [Aspergillus flavus NRRL3357]|nr:hypothetical protein AFLA_001550 [Aspergillus flavus NRRL3357]
MRITFRVLEIGALKTIYSNKYRQLSRLTPTKTLCPPQILRIAHNLLSITHLSYRSFSIFIVQLSHPVLKKIASSPNLKTHLSRHSGPKERKLRSPIFRG